MRKMNPLFVFLILLVGAPLVELYVLIRVGSVIGALPTVALSIFTAVLGAFLVRMQGLSVLLRVQQTLARGEAPALELLEGAVLMMAGIALLFPGFITDAMGFLLLVPPLRRRLILAVLRRSGTLKPPPGPPPSSARIIETQWRRDD